jgi:hypothetical protein
MPKSKAIFTFETKYDVQIQHIPQFDIPVTGGLGRFFVAHNLPLWM